MERKFTSCKEEKKEKNKLTLSHDYHMVIVKKKMLVISKIFVC